jgi:hypothetical protein
MYGGHPAPGTWLIGTWLIKVLCLLRYFFHKWEEPVTLLEELGSKA